MDFFGDMCNEQCSDTCLRTSNDLLTRYCIEENGHCIHGCRAGWFGERCTEGCSKYCKDSECYRNSGSCVYGCLQGYYGYRCEQGIIISRVRKPIIWIGFSNEQLRHKPVCTDKILKSWRTHVLLFWTPRYLSLCLR